VQHYRPNRDNFVGAGFIPPEKLCSFADAGGRKAHPYFSRDLVWQNLKAKHIQRKNDADTG